jgi:DNA-binding PadR family transcriptional regulator
MQPALMDPDRLPPLTPAVFYILLALADGDKHGYAIMKEVEERTERQIVLRPGTLYQAISRLLSAGLIAEVDERPDPAVDDERRRYYRLTLGGRAALATEAQRLARAVQVAREKRVLPQGLAGAIPAGG